ncbi:MAG: hypothetical protein J6I73_05220 [Treponema sp.]|nr:hypothetical protein [Treponema sp.]
MKRILLSVAAAAMMATAASAFNFELDLNYQAILKNSFTIEKIDNYAIPKSLQSKIAYSSPFGIDANCNFYFGSPWIMDIGLNVGGGFELFTDVTANGNSIRKTIITPLKDAGVAVNAIGFGGFAKLGPAFRFNLHKMHSLYFSPAFFFGYDSYDVTYEGTTAFRIEAAALGIDFDVGYRLWLVNRERFSFGLDIGLDFTVPVYIATYSRAAGEGGVDGEAGHAFGTKLYIGVCLNSGKRAYR